MAGYGKDVVGWKLALCSAYTNMQLSNGDMVISDVFWDPDFHC